MSFVFKRGSIPSSVEVDRDVHVVHVVHTSVSSTSCWDCVPHRTSWRMCVELSEHSGS